MKIRETIIIASFFVLFGSLSDVNAYEFPPYQGLRLKVLGDISENYSNNVTFASNDRNKVEDFRTMLNLGLDFKYEGKRRSVDFSGRARRQISRGSSNVRNSTEDISLIFNNEFSKYDRIYLQGIFHHTQEPGLNLADFDLNACRDYYRNLGWPPGKIDSQCTIYKEQFDRLRGRFDSYNDNFSFAYNKDLSDSFKIITNYSYGENWSTAAGTKDSQQNTATVSINYKYVEATIFSMSYTYQIFNYKEAKDISRQSYKAGVTQYITKRFFFNGNLGVDNVSSGNDSISFQATLRSEVDENTTASLSYSRGTEISSFQGDTFRHWQLTANAARALSENLGSSLSAFYGKGYYSSTGVSDTLTGIGFNFSYNIWESQRGADIKGNLGYSFSKLNSSDKNRGYTATSATSSLTLAF